MTEVALWSLIVGAVFLLSGLARGPLRRTPISMPLIYLLVGIGIGPWGLNLLDLNLVDDAKVLEVVAEIAVLVSLLTAGLRLTPSWKMYLRSPIPLATVGMTLTILGIAAIGYFALGLSFGAAIVLGAVLAPTDPVLASEVQVKHKDDRDKLRYSLTGEVGLNDGTAFPFIMLGLGLMGLHGIGDVGWRWFAVDLFWATIAGIASGWGMGYFINRLAIWVKRKTDAPAACEELLTLGLIGLSYGIAIAIHSYGFLAVFSAGVATRLYSERDQGDDHPEKTMQTVAKINEQFERILEVAMVAIIGVLISNTFTLSNHWWVPLAIFAIIRPGWCSGWPEIPGKEPQKEKSTKFKTGGIPQDQNLNHLSDSNLRLHGCLRCPACGPSSQNDAGLAKIIAAWPKLSNREQQLLIRAVE